MKSLKIDTTNKLYYEKLDNGMDIYIYYIPEHYKTVANLTVKFGSINEYFEDQEGAITLPMGTAHFLEHQMFENKNENIFSLFSNQGSKINAFTNIKYTSYSISTATNINENIHNLIEMVHNLDISEEHIDKEKKIILQELNLYQDNIDWLSRYSILQLLFNDSPICNHIGGTLDSIQKIDISILKRSHQYFYTPSNMKLFIASPMNPSNLLDIVKNSQIINKNIEVKPNISPLATNKLENKRIKLPIKTSKVYIGYRLTNFKFINSLLKNEIILDIAFEVLFNNNCENFQKFKLNNLISSSIQWDINLEEEFGYIIINFESDEPYEAQNNIAKFIENNFKNGMNSEIFNSTKSMRITETLSKFNSIEYISNKFSQYAFKNENILTSIQIINNLEEYDVISAVKDLLNPCNKSYLIIEGK
ncbi:EF-P 5-aminopentanol modification-associated protein YfmH [Mammaliicoccus sciuri]|uniref:EF-P 5-aminopentanol modification-associated protein YfmH n=1 Tax=Mammaliicoccus sciuri TaxID=1296 RepID=UPI003A94898A